MGSPQPDARALHRCQFPHEVDVVVLGAGTALAALPVLAGVVEAPHGAAVCLQGQAGVLVERSQGVGVVLPAADDAARGVDDDQAGVVLAGEAADSLTALSGIERRQVRE